MERKQLILQVEALVFASQQPITISDLTEHVSNLADSALAEEEVEQALNDLIEKYSIVDFPFELKAVGGGYQFLTKAAFHETVMQLNGDKFIKKLSTAAMETLSIVAYKQPVTKSDIEFIRGVSADYSIQKLLEKELIIISGRKEDAVGKPLLYNTSKHFMDYLGINSTEQLPKLKEVGGGEIVFPTDALNAIPLMEQLTIGEGEF